MKKFCFLLAALMIAFPAQAQFAPGYAPQREDEAPARSSVFQQQPQEPVQQEPARQQVVPIPTPYSGNIRILATVNGEIITTEDINYRVRAFCQTTGIPYNDQTKLLIINKVMQNTIDEKLKLQDAAKNKITVSPAEIEDAMINYAKSNNMTLAKLRQGLYKAGISEAIFREQMKSDIAWVRLIRSKTAMQTVTEIEIQDARDATKRDMKSAKYMVLEIVIPKKGAKDVYELARTLREDPRFELYASQFSQSPSSVNGGRLGWINSGQLAEPLDKVLSKMNSGQVSDPVLYDGSYYIFKVEKKFDPEKDKLPDPSADEIAEMLRGQKMERYAARHLQGLRQRASIEMRE